MRSVMQFAIAFLIFYVRTYCAVSATPAAELQTLVFIKNGGQWPSSALYKMQTPQACYWIESDGFTVDSRQIFYSPRSEFSSNLKSSRDIDSVRGHVLKIQFTYAKNTAPSSLSLIRPSKKLQGCYNYFLGNDSTKWARNVPSYSELHSELSASQVDIRFYVDQSSLRYDLIVQKGADISSIGLKIKGADDIRVNAQGDLIVKTSVGDLVQQKPVAYQFISGRRQDVICSFDKRADGSIGFHIGRYNRSEALIIDPLIWATYVGGSAMAGGSVNGPGTEDCNDIALDAAGNPVVVGTTETNDFPTTVGSYKRLKTNIDPRVSTSDIFIAKFSADGSNLIFATYLGGTFQDLGHSIELDAADNIYICGGTSSTEFPTTLNAYSRVMNGSADGVITKLNANGSALLASTFIGGIGYDVLLSVKLDNAYVYVCGNSFTSGYPVSSAAFQSVSTRDYAPVVSVLSQNLQALDASSYCGGLAVPNDLVIDASGRIYITGVAYDSLVPTTTNAISRTRNGVFGDLFLVELSRNCSTLLYGTYMGGEIEDIALGIALDASNNIIVCGKTMSPDFPTTLGAYDRSYNSIRGSARTQDPYDDVFDGFVVKISPSYQLLWSTFVGGRASDWFTHVVTASNGTIILSGISYSANFPATSCCIDSTQNGAADCVLTLLNASGNSISYSTFLGGGGIEIANSVVRQSNGMLFICGSTYDKSFPITIGAYQTTRRLSDGFVAKVDPSSGLTVNAGTDILYSCTGFGNTVYLQAIPSCGTGPYSYQWTPTTGLSDARSDRPFTTTTPSGIEYTVVVMDATGTRAVNTVSLVPLLMIVNPGKDTALCWGRNARLATTVTGGMGAKTYSWFPARGLDNPASANPLANPDTTTNYILIVSDTSGCQKADTVTVRVSHATLNYTRDTVLCGTKQVQLSPRIVGAIAPLSFKWSTKTGVTLSTSPSPTFSIDSATTFYFSVSDSLNCTTRDSVLVRTSPPISLTIKSDSVTCAQSPATFSVSITGGMKPYTISWKSSDTTLNIVAHDTVGSVVLSKTTALSVLVRDSAGCVSAKNFSIRVDSTISVRITADQNKKVFCKGSSLQLDAGSYAGASYTWSTGEKTQKIKVTNEGWYSVGVRNKKGCETKDSTYIRLHTPAPARLFGPKDTVVCEGELVTLHLDGVWSSYRWSNGLANTSIQVALPGKYWVDVSDSVGCSVRSDTVSIVVRKVLSTLRGPNSLCIKTEATFEVDSVPDAVIHWTLSPNCSLIDGQNTRALRVRWNVEGSDSVLVEIVNTMTGCTLRITKLVSISSTLRPVLSLSRGPVLCQNDTLSITAPTGYATYLWSTGEQTNIIRVSKPGLYAVTVSSGVCVGTSDSILVSMSPPLSLSIQGDSLLCENESTLLTGTSGYRRYTWSTGDTTSSILVRESGSYSLMVLDTNGCQATSTHRVRYHQRLIQKTSTLSFGDVPLPQFSSQTLNIPNTSDEEFELNSLVLKHGNKGFTIPSVNVTFPTKLPPLSSIVASLVFAPLSVDSFEDTLEIIVAKPCPDTLRFSLFGRGTKSTIISTVRMTQVEKQFGDVDVHLPVYCSFSPERDYSNVDCILRVTLDANMFSLTSVSKGTIVSNTVDAKRIRTIEVAFNNAALRNGDVLCDLKGIALVSDSNSTMLQPSIEWLRGLNAQTLSVPGTLKVRGCGINFQTIDYQPELALSVKPNPSSSELTFEILTYDKGIHHCQIYNIQGEVVEEFRFYTEKSPHTEFRSFASLPSGVYSIVVRNNQGLKSKRFSVVR